MEEEVEQGRLNNSTIVMATDNSTVESALYKGNSSSQKLYDLVIRFRALELKSGSKFMVTHVSGKRMMAQGTDGLSRDQMREGVSLGRAMNDFCPWGKSALERSLSLKIWFEDVCGPKLEVLAPEQWFSRGHDHSGGCFDSPEHLSDNFKPTFWRPNIKQGIYLWHPPPAAADAAIEEIRKARIKRTQSTHVVAIPRLFTPQWLKQLNKICDVVFSIPPSADHWDSHQFEPLIVGIAFPYLRYFPYQLKSTYKMLAMGSEIQKMLRDPDMDQRNLLREFLAKTRSFYSMSAGVLRKVLYFGRKNEIVHQDTQL